MSTEEIFSTLGIALIVIIIFYLGTWQRRKNQKEIKKMQENLKKGDKVVTFSGLSGIIDEVLEDRIILKTYPDNLKISLEKWAVAGLDDRTIK